MTFSPSLLATQAVMRFLPAAPTPTPTPNSGGSAGGGSSNPFAGMTPNFDFGADFNQTWTRGFVAFWGILIIGAGAFLAFSLFKLSSATSSGHPNEVQQAKKQVVQAALGLSGLVAFTSIIGIFFFLF